MMIEKNDNKKKENIEILEEKILFGEKEILCFACGEKLDISAKKCPYCEISLD